MRKDLPLYRLEFVCSAHRARTHTHTHTSTASIAVTLFSITLFNRIRIQAKYIKRCNLFRDATLVRLHYVVDLCDSVALFSPHFPGAPVRHPLLSCMEHLQYFTIAAVQCDIHRHALPLSRSHAQTHDATL